MIASQPRPAQFGSRSPCLARHGCRNLAISLFSAPSAKRVIDLRRRSDEEELVAQHLSHRAEHRDVLKARQHDHVETKLLDVIGRRERGATKPDLQKRAGAGSVHLLDLNTEVGVVGLVLLDADDLKPVLRCLFLCCRLLRVGIRRWIVQDADFLHLCLVLQILQPRFNFEARRRNGGEGPFHVVRLLRQDRAQHHRNFGAQPQTVRPRNCRPKRNRCRTH